MTEAKELAAAERCSLFLLDKHTGELVSKVFDGNEVNNSSAFFLFFTLETGHFHMRCVHRNTLHLMYLFGLYLTRKSSIGFIP